MLTLKVIDDFLVTNRKGLIMTLMVGVIMWAGTHCFSQRYLLLVNGQQGPSCLPYDVYLVDRLDKDLSRGQLFSFVGKNMSPFFPDGIAVTKEVAGLPGDHVKIEGREMGNTFINGLQKSVKLDLLDYFPDKNVSEFEVDENIPDGKILALGRMANSFDSRYWGYVDSSNVLGRTYAIW